MPFEIGPAIEENKRHMQEIEPLIAVKLDPEFVAFIDVMKRGMGARDAYWREKLRRLIEDDDLAVVDAEPSEQRRAPKPAAQQSKKRARRQLSSQGEDFLTMQETAGSVGVSYKTIYNWIRSGRLKHFKIGSTVRIPREAITELFQQRGQHGEA